MSNITATTFTYLGGQFQVGNGANPEVFTTISQVKEVDFSGTKWENPEVTSADNTDSVRRYTGTLFDPGTVTVTIHWNPEDATHQQLQAQTIAGGTHNFKRINPGGFGTRTFSGLYEGSVDIKQSIDKPTEGVVKIKLSGPFVDS